MRAGVHLTSGSPEKRIQRALATRKYFTGKKSSRNWRKMCLIDME